MFDKLSLLGRDLLIDTLPHLIDGTATATPQNEADVTFSPTIKSDEERVDFTLPVNLVDAKIRACVHFQLRLLC